MKLYMDKDLQEEIVTVDLGILQAGSSKEIVIYCLNDTKAMLIGLSFTAEGLEVNGPNILGPGQSGSITIHWSTDLTLRKPLETELTITGIEEYRGIKQW